MFNRKKYHKCSKCNGHLMPKLNPHTNTWMLTCENKQNNSCIENILEVGFQEVFERLFGWNLNEFDIHDLIKSGKKSYFIIHAIDFIERINIKIYKHRIKALKDYLKLPYGHIFNSLIIRLRYKFTSLYYIIKLIAFSFLVLSLAGTYAILTDNYKDNYIDIVTGKINRLPGEYLDEEKLDILIEEEKLENIDTDGDGLSDKDEIEQYLTDPKNKDTDGDGYSDGDEIKGGYDPLSAK